MRLDKYLKVSRIIKRRTIAKEVADNGRILVNDRIAKSSTKLSVGDVMCIYFGNKEVVIRVLELQESTKKENAKNMFEIIEEKSYNILK
ncbi:MAG: RNA-binding S4 domain-containing protein [Candidatus Izimaplasma sp.]|nr:RNA-binding S4 domain-containing protein [Candidatus Izimaplasma bacterium]